MCLAVKYIHDRRILHRDIKSQVGVVTSFENFVVKLKFACGRTAFE